MSIILTRLVNDTKLGLYSWQVECKAVLCKHLDGLEERASRNLMKFEQRLMTSPASGWSKPLSGWGEPGWGATLWERSWGCSGQQAGQEATACPGSSEDQTASWIVRLRQSAAWEKWLFPSALVLARPHLGSAYCFGSQCGKVINKLELFGLEKVQDSQGLEQWPWGEAGAWLRQGKEQL